MGDKPISAREKIARLKASFVEQLPQRLDEARALVERLVADAEDRDAAARLHRILHGLKGTGRSFGFAALGNAAEPGEELAACLIGETSAPLPDRWQEVLVQCLDRLQQLADAEVHKVGKGGSAEEAPGFSLAPDTAGEQVRRGGRVVYLCDDDELLVRQLAAQLACFGYETSAFTDADALRAAIAGHLPDALVLDINFPEGSQSGTEVLADLRRVAAPDVPAVFLSSRNDFDARLRAVRAGGQAYFTKPTRPLDLVAVLDDLTQHRREEPYRILIVDDEPEAASYHALILEEAGMVTCRAGDPARVIDALRECRPDMVLMDMYMPVCSGHELARVIRQFPEYLALPIIYLSSETDRAKQISAMRIGAEGFLTKPVVPDDLVAAVAIRAERMRILRSLMARDSLTGLFNHTTTTQLLENAVGNARRQSGHLCFAMIDIDSFKSINDSHGHPVGDQVILALSRLLQQRLRASDTVGRYGGEEFAVTLHDVSEDKAAALIDQLRIDFSRVVFHAGGQAFSCTFSAGVAGFPKHARWELLREAADRALYEAKRGGRNRIVVDQDAS